MTNQEVVNVPVVVPPSVLVPTGMIEGIEVATAAECTPALVVAEAEAPEAEVAEPVSMVIEIPKRKRGRPRLEGKKAEERALAKRNTGVSYWELVAPTELSSYLCDNYPSGMHPFVTKALIQGFGVAQSYDRTGVMTMPREDVENTAVSQGGRLFFKNEIVSAYAWKDAEVRFQFRSQSLGRISVKTSDPLVHSMWETFGKAWLTAPPVREYRPQINSFIKTSHGIDVVSVGELSDTFEPGNYPDSVVADYRYICEQFRAVEPVGRLALLEGVPGTGKTRLIRALICELMTDANCILVAPNALPHLSGVDFLASLIQQHRIGRPIVLILEDADACLIKRDEDKASLDSLTGLLNLSDGILGSTLNIRIIATTNAKLESLDAAVTRPGRLIRRVTMGALSKEKAAAAFARITGKTQEFDSETTIASVYAAAAAVGNMEAAAHEAEDTAKKAAEALADEVEDELMNLEG